MQFTTLFPQPFWVEKVERSSIKSLENRLVRWQGKLLFGFTIVTFFKMHAVKLLGINWLTTSTWLKACVSCKCEHTCICCTAGRNLRKWEYWRHESSGQSHMAKISVLWVRGFSRSDRSMQSDHNRMQHWIIKNSDTWKNKSGNTLIHTGNEELLPVNDAPDDGFKMSAEELQAFNGEDGTPLYSANEM